jgi:hypothetical protein
VSGSGWRRSRLVPRGVTRWAAVVASSAIGVFGLSAVVAPTVATVTATPAAAAPAASYTFTDTAPSVYNIDQNQTMTLTQTVNVTGTSAELPIQWQAGEAAPQRRALLAKYPWYW